jgi:hypothetical protein
MSNEAIHLSAGDEYKRELIEILGHLPAEIIVEVKYPGMERHFPEPITLEASVIREMAQAWLSIKSGS